MILSEVLHLGSAWRFSLDVQWQCSPAKSICCCQSLPTAEVTICTILCRVRKLIGICLECLRLLGPSNIPPYLQAMLFKTRQCCLAKKFGRYNHPVCYNACYIVWANSDQNTQRYCTRFHKRPIASLNVPINTRLIILHALIWDNIITQFCWSDKHVAAHMQQCVAHDYGALHEQALFSKARACPSPAFSVTATTSWALSLSTPSSSPAKFVKMVSWWVMIQ